MFSNHYSRELHGLFIRFLYLLQEKAGEEVSWVSKKDCFVI